MIRGVIDLILDDAGCQALIGTKVFPVTVTQEVKKPYVTVRRTGQSPTIVKGQVSDCDLVQFNVAVFADTYKECVDISAAVRTSLDEFSGTKSGKNYYRIWYLTSEDTIDEQDNCYVIVDGYAMEVQR
jgi:hypothetical protein